MGALQNPNLNPNPKNLKCKSFAWVPRQLGLWTRARELNAFEHDQIFLRKRKTPGGRLEVSSRNNISSRMANRYTHIFDAT